MDEPNQKPRAKSRATVMLRDWPAAWVLSGCLVCLILSACSSSPHLIVYQAKNEWVDLRDWPVGYPEQPPRAHPQTISPETIQQILQSVYYRESLLFSYLLGKPKHVFTDYQIERLTSTLPKAFDQALPQEVVAYQLRTDINSSRFTTGFCFITDHALHLVVEAIRRPHIQPKDTRSQPYTVQTELVARTGQRLFSTDTERESTRPDWIVIQLDPAQGMI